MLAGVVEPSVTVISIVSVTSEYPLAKDALFAVSAYPRVSEILHSMV